MDIPIDQDWLRLQHVAIATPMADGWVHHEYLHALVKTLQQFNLWGIALNVLTVPGQTVEKARNLLVKAFLDDPELSQMVWIDADQSWEPVDVARLVASRKPVIGAPVRKKCQGSEWNVCVLGDSPYVVDETGAFEVEAIGTGFLCVERDVYRALAEWYPMLRLRHEDESPHYFAFFQSQVKGGIWTSEDIAFCQLWREIGGTVWADPFATIGHYGEKNYVGRFADSYAIQESAAGVRSAGIGGPLTGVLPQSA